MEGKTYLISGAAGIAAETIKIMVLSGHNVYYVSLEEAECEKLHQEINLAHKTAYMVGDLTHEPTVKDLVLACVKKFGRVDGLFNVAGMSGRKFGDAPLHECSLEGWQKTLDINLTTQFQMCKYVINQMLSQKVVKNQIRGVIVNMSSVLAFSPEQAHFNAIAYATSKGAIISMTKTAAAYYARHKIRINAIAPGLALTKMSARASENVEILKHMKKKQPLAEMAIKAKDVAKAAAFLLSDNASMITGETLTVDAGWCIS